ncbi:MAG: hypothetical protein KGH98_01785 [Candidatus Micrarchaeota archaeon]|nr:hypothetical protein [Candidatus Micrarchaeota archaeon]
MPRYRITYSMDESVEEVKADFIVTIEIGAETPEDAFRYIKSEKAKGPSAMNTKLLADLKISFIKSIERLPTGKLD